MVRNSGILIVIVFAVSSLFHFYWALGGSLGHGITVPSARGTRLFNPSPMGTILVGVALLLAMLILLGRLGVWGSSLPRWVFNWGTWGISLIFLLRAVGEFRYVGFFKRNCDTRFAHWDMWLFSPLCLLISVVAGVVAYNEA